MFGNTNQPVEVMAQTGHLFAPMPEIIRNHMAFIDRLHYYLPGWEIPKMHNANFTDHYGFVVDYVAESSKISGSTTSPKSSIITLPSVHI